MPEDDTMTSSLYRVIMQQMGVAEAKRRFSELIDRVARGERFVITRRGRPVMILGAPDPEPEEVDDTPKVGLVALVGALGDVWPTITEDMAEIVAMRRHARDRDLPDDLIG